MKPEPYWASTKKEMSNDEKNQRKKVSKTYKSGDRNTLLGREAKRQRSTKSDWYKETKK